MHITSNQPLTGSISVTLLTTLTPNPCFVTYRTESNDSDDFLLCIAEFIRIRALTEGDILIMDNARVHDSKPLELKQLCESNGIQVKSLPVYRQR